MSNTLCKMSEQNLHNIGQIQYCVDIVLIFYTKYLRNICTILGKYLHDIGQISTHVGQISAQYWENIAMYDIHIKILLGYFV